MFSQRASGVLMHISSLPSPHGIGDLGPCAYQFVDFLVKSKQRYWQILPVNPTDGINGHSPYSSNSAYAGNPLLISPDLLLKDKWISKKDLKLRPRFPEGAVDYPKVISWKVRLLKTAFETFQQQGPNGTFNKFCAEHDHWLHDFALFVIAKEKFQGRAWSSWPSGMKLRDARELQKFSQKHFDQLQKIEFEQFLFYTQWNHLKAYCAKKGIELIGDMPIYVNYDGADVWKNPKLFKLDKNLKLKYVSGVPPDYFSKTGQRWGNPVYDWARMRKNKYDWWIARIRHNLMLFDYLRIDHFRGFAGFWQIPAYEKIAIYGRWIKAPGKDFFKTLLKRLGRIPIIAEDLGYITQDVVELLKQFQLPGMRVLLFAFDDYSKGNPHHPENYPRNCVAYTGTHDNNTVQGWFRKDASWHARENVMRHLGHSVGRDVHWDFIQIVMKSLAQTAIIPLQDVLGLGEEARVNRPSTTYHNWEWRLKPSQLKPQLITKLAKVTKSAKRA